MKFAYSITLADLQNAQWLHWHQTPRRRATYYSIHLLIPALFSTLVIMFLSHLGVFFVHLSAIYTFALGFVISAAVTTVGFFRKQSKMYRKLFDKNFPPCKRTTWCVVDDDGIVSTIAGNDEEKRTWQEFMHFAQNEEIMLLYMSEKKFMFIPTHSLSVEQRTELLGFVDRFVREKK